MPRRESVRYTRRELNVRGKVAKKLRKIGKHDWIEYYLAMQNWEFSARWRFCWKLLFGKRGKKKHGK